MLEFPIKWNIQIIDDTEGRQISSLKLNKDWTILLVWYDDGWVCYADRMEIHRNDTAGDFFLTGEIRIKQSSSQLKEKKLSQFIETGSSFTEIWSNINLYHSDLSLHGFVNIHVINKKHTTSLANEESKEKIQLQSLAELSKDLERLLSPESLCFADVTLKCGGVSIPAHKNILSARSPVFEAMFANQMKESIKNEVEITDILESTLRVLLLYLYTGKSSDLTVSSAADLLFAADKYQLQDLKTVCSHFLKDRVSAQNVWKILVLGDMHSEDLKCFAVDYICNTCDKFSVVENTQEWKTVRKDRPDLAFYLMESLIKNREAKLSDKN